MTLDDNSGCPLDCPCKYQVWVTMRNSPFEELYFASDFLPEAKYAAHFAEKSTIYDYELIEVISRGTNRAWLRIDRRDKSKQPIGNAIGALMDNYKPGNNVR